jgi:hypothetical protein
MTAVLVRILLRYGAGILIAKGLLAPEVGVEIARDPDVAMALQVIAGLLVGALSEGWYVLAKRFGWRV